MQISPSGFSRNLTSFPPASSFGGGFPPQNTRIGVGPNTYANQPVVNRQPMMVPNRSFDRLTPNYAPNRSFSPLPPQRTNVPVGMSAPMPMGMPMGNPGSYIPLGPMIPVGSVNPIVNPIGPIGQINPQGNQRMLGVSSPFPMPYPPQPAYLGYKILKDIPPQYQKQQQQQQFNVVMEQPKVYCVLCQRQYQSKDRQQHARRHRRQQQEGFQIKNMIKQIQTQNNIPQTRPIVQPQEYNIQYNPNQYILQKIVNYVTPEPVPVPVPIRPSNINNSNIQPVPSIANPSINPNQSSIQGGGGLNQSNYQPQSIRLTTEGQTITYNDPNTYQGGRIQRQSQINPQQIISPIVNDSRFSNNSLIVDEPIQPLLPQSLYRANRQTIQQQQPNINMNMSNNLSGSVNSNTGLQPQRPTVVSQQFRDSQYIPPIANTNSISNPQMYGSLSPSQRIQQNHQSVMSPIRQESMRQTASVAGQETRLSQQQINQSNTGISNQGYLSNRASQKPQQPSILDDFGYEIINSNRNIIPRQSRNTAQNQRQLSQIPFSQIINEKIG